MIFDFMDDGFDLSVIMMSFLLETVMLVTIWLMIIFTYFIINGFQRSFFLFMMLLILVCTKITLIYQTVAANARHYGLQKYKLSDRGHV